MNFGKALETLKNGGLVQRVGWNGKGMFLFLVNGSRFIVNRAPLLGIFSEGTEIDYCPHIDMFTADEKVVPWLASQTDILADDWQEVELAVETTFDEILEAVEDDENIFNEGTAAEHYC